MRDAPFLSVAPVTSTKSSSCTPSRRPRNPVMFGATILVSGPTMTPPFSQRPRSNGLTEQNLLPGKRHPAPRAVRFNHPHRDQSCRIQLKIVSVFLQPATLVVLIAGLVCSNRRLLYRCSTCTGCFNFMPIINRLRRRAAARRRPTQLCFGRGRASPRPVEPKSS